MSYFSGLVTVSAFIITLFGDTYCDFLTFTSNETVTIQGVTDGYRHPRVRRLVLPWLVLFGYI
jgi:hypothetical protein